MGAELTVAIVCHQFPPWRGGGLAEYAAELARQLRHRLGGRHVEVFAMRPPPGTGDEPDGPRPPGLTLVDGPAQGRPLPRGRLALPMMVWHVAWFNLVVVAELARRRRRPGLVVSVHDWQSAPAAIAAARLLRLPVVYHAHNTEQTMGAAPDIGDPGGLLGALERLAVRSAHAVVVPTPEMQALVLRHGWRPRDLVVIPHGLAPLWRSGRTRAALLRQRGWPPGTKLLVFAGRLSPTKGVQQLLRAMPAILREHPDARLVLLGQGMPGTGQARVVEDLIERLGLRGQVHATHRMEPRGVVQDHFAAADVCVFPSSYEPFGLVSLEAMAEGAACVLGPGFSTIITAAPDGPVCWRTGSAADDIAAQVSDVLRDPAELAARGRRADAHVRRRFSWDRTMDQTLDTYARVRSGSAP